MPKRPFKPMAIGVSIILLAALPGVAGAASHSRVALHKAGRVGQTLHVKNNFDLRLYGVKVSAGTATIRPDPGYQFLITGWRFHNPQKHKVHATAESFTIESGGTTYQPLTDSVKLSAFDGDKLGLAGQTYGPGNTDTDDIVFQVNVNALRDKTLRTRAVYSPFFIHLEIRAVWRLTG